MADYLTSDYGDIVPHNERCDMAMANHDQRIAELETKCATMQRQLSDMGMAIRGLGDVLAVKVPAIAGDWHLNE